MQPYDFKQVEEEIENYWQEHKIYEEARSRGKQDFYFLDGPPYTSGRVHIGTAWNKSLKDMVLRYKRMQGFKVWDRAGYDMHGIPTEQGVERELGIQHKDEIPKFGVEKFVLACREFSIRNMHLMNKDFRRLGVWMDFDNAYQPIKREYIEGEWWLIKKAHENNRLYEGERTMHWCAKCGTALAKHELEYKIVKDNSIFLKFKVEGKEDEYLVIWTTTPWTIPFNLGVMVNPNLEYVKARVEGEIWIVAKGLAAAFIQGVADKQFTIEEEFLGEKLKGLRYIHPFHDDIPIYRELSQLHPKAFTVVLSEEFVDLSAGTGLVHMAPGCGPEDYEVGHKEGIPPFNNLDEAGVFPRSMGEFAGLRAKKDDYRFVEALDRRGVLIAQTPVEHDYAHCWRCKSPVIFRTTKQWFFRVEDMIEEMREFNRNIHWVPEYAGSRQFDSWLSNLRDNGITRQRFWGTPLPVWRCDRCAEFIVIGSIKELEQYAKNIPDDLHKPWIDEVTWNCHCDGVMRRIPDILDVWIDAGSASWNCLDYPRRTDLFEKLYPADFILEGIDQIRGWFNLLMVASMVSMHKPSFKSVYMHGFVQDALGRKMSKSLGNYILPEEVIGKYGADTLRYYMIGCSSPGQDLNYNFDDMKIKSRNLSILWNLHNFLIDFVRLNRLSLEQADLGLEEKYIISRLNSTIKKATESMDLYQMNDVPNLVETLFLDLSRSYIQMVREKAASGSAIEKQAVAYTMKEVLVSSLKMFSIVCPFISEKMYLNLKDELKLKEKGIHLSSWPVADEGMIDENLESAIETASGIIQSVLRLREQEKLNVRWPVHDIIVVTQDEEVAKAVELTTEVIKVLTNSKELIVRKELPNIKSVVKADYNKIGPDFGSLTPQIIAKLLSDSSDSILEHIKQNNKYVMKLDNKEVVLVKEHFIIEREVPKPYVEASFRSGFVYLNTKSSPALEAEGFSRELTRRVQQLRKEAGLTKSDTIILEIACSEQIRKMIEPHRAQMQEKVGADLLSFEPKEGYLAMKKEDIKNFSVEIFLRKS